jgi:hypothetical protein
VVTVAGVREKGGAVVPGARCEPDNPAPQRICGADAERLCARHLSFQEGEAALTQLRSPALLCRLAAGTAAAGRAVSRVWRRLLPQTRPVPIIVVIADRRRGRRLRRRLAVGVRQLQLTFGQLPLTIVVQERLDGGRRVGCHRVCQRPDGTPTTLIRLALTLGEHHLTVDELLAALVDECVALQDPLPHATGFEALFADLGAARNGVPG